MTTGHDLVESGLKYRGQPYSTKNPDRYMSNSGVKDCSGLVAASLSDIRVPYIGSVSSEQARTCYNHGGEISVEAAFGIEGALLFMGADRGLKGFGPDGHVAISDGKGGVVETPAWGDTGHAAGHDNARGRNWSGAGLIPGIDYSGAHGPGVPDPGNCTPTLQRGARGASVGILQHALQRAGYHLQADEQFGPSTEGAVRDFQSHHGLAADGVCGPATWAALSAIPGPVPPPQPGQPAMPEIRNGSQGPAVRVAQQRLNVKVNARISADGVFGPATDRAVRKFQANIRNFFHLPNFAVDGIVGPATWFWLLS